MSTIDTKTRDKGKLAAFKYLLKKNPLKYSIEHKGTIIILFERIFTNYEDYDGFPIIDVELKILDKVEFKIKGALY